MLIFKQNFHHHPLIPFGIYQGRRREILSSLNCSLLSASRGTEQGPGAVVWPLKLTGEAGTDTECVTSTEPRAER